MNFFKKNIVNKDYLYQGIACFLIINTFIFYTLIFKVIFESNSDMISKYLKIIFIIIITVIFIRNFKDLLNSKVLTFIFFIGLIYSIFKVNYIFITCIPIMIGLIISRLDIDVLLNEIIKYSLFIIFLLVIIYIIYYSKFTVNDYIALRPDSNGNMENLIHRKTFIFKSPNNIGLFLNILSLIAIILSKNKIFIILSILSIMSYIYTNSRGGLIIAVILIFINIFKGFIVRNKKITLIFMLGLTFIPLLIVYLIDEEIFTNLDHISSHRLHYIDILFKFSILPNISGYMLDSSLISFLNTQGLILTIMLIIVIFRTALLSDKSFILVVGTLLIGLFENIINQYILLLPLVYSIYFIHCKNNHITHQSNHH